MADSDRMYPSYHPVELSLDQCIKCNICVTKCPVAPVTDLFPGPKYEGPQAGRFRGTGLPSPDHSVDYCSGCRVCNLACPTGVKIAEINARARAEMVRQGKFSWRTRLRNNLLARSELIGKFGVPVAPLANLAFSSPLIRTAIDLTLRIHRRAPLPLLSNYRFTSWFRRHPKPAKTIGKVVYFHGCATQYYEPHIGKAAVAVLEANGFEVIVPPQNCCGLPLLSNGEFPAARRYHQSNVRHLVEFARQGIPIIGTSTSCTLTLKDEAPELLDMHDEDSRLVARGVYDIHEFLLGLLEQRRLNLDFQALSLKTGALPYHAPCQYRAHLLGRPAAEIMRLIPGLKFRESHSDCCGIAGTYGYKTEKYQIGQDVGSSLFNFILGSGEPLAICDSETCRWQITHATGVPCVHPIELLAAAYGTRPEGALVKFLG